MSIPLQVDHSSLEELDLSGCGLSAADLSKFPRLIKASLAHNDIKTLEGKLFIENQPIKTLTYNLCLICRVLISGITKSRH